MLFRSKATSWSGRKRCVDAHVNLKQHVYACPVAHNEPRQHRGVDKKSVHAHVNLKQHVYACPVAHNEPRQHRGVDEKGVWMHM